MQQKISQMEGYSGEPYQTPEKRRKGVYNTVLITIFMFFFCFRFFFGAGAMVLTTCSSAYGSNTIPFLRAHAIDTCAAVPSLNTRGFVTHTPERPSRMNANSRISMRPCFAANDKTSKSKVMPKIEKKKGKKKKEREKG